MIRSGGVLRDRSGSFPLGLPRRGEPRAEFVRSTWDHSHLNIPCDSNGEQGFLLIALVVAVFIIALFLTVAAPTVARSLERDKEVESEHRAQQYVRAIHNYYLKFNSYPTSIDQLLSQNNQHFLRQQYKDPLTGGDYRLIHSGEAKTQVKGFFGEPLEGMAQGSLGALAGNASGIGTGVGGAGSSATTGASGASSSGSGGFSLGTSSFSSTSSSTAGAATGTGMGGSTSDSTGSASSSGSGSIDATKFQGSKGTIVGVGSNATGHGLVEWNGSENIEDWEFLYDHRTWLLRQRVSIFGGSVGQSGGGSLGTSGTGSSFGSSSFGSGGFGSTSSSAASSSSTTTSQGSGSATQGTSGSGTSATQP